MAETIRKVKLEDFEQISCLFEGEEGNSVKDLKWLFENPNEKGEFNAFVAVNKSGTIIGVIAYTLSTFYQHGKSVIGMIPMSWKLKPNYKGMAGISLFNKVSSFGEICFAIGGSEIAKKMYPMFKYDFLHEGMYFYKILKPFSYFKILKRSNLLKKTGMFFYLMPSYFKSTKNNRFFNELNLVPYNSNNFILEKENKDIFSKEITKNYVDWLLKCPRVKAYAFVVQKGNDSIGITILFKQKFNSSFKGRIVYLPFLGYEKFLWAAVINKCIDFLKKENCCFISGMALHKVTKEAYRSAGFLEIKDHSEYIYLKDKNNQASNKFNFNNWNFQFVEIDTALVNF